MGIIDNLRRATGIAGRPGRIPMRSPFAAVDLTRVVLEDLFNIPAPHIGRAEAMQVPSIVKGRAIICGTLSRYPLAKYRKETRVESDPWMTKNAGDVSPQVRMLWTLDDLIFSGASLWALERNTKGLVTNAARVPPELWTVNEDLEIRVQDKPVSSEEVCYFEGPQEGLTTLARNTILGALDMETAWQKRVSSPVPLVELHSTDPNGDLEQYEANELVKQWEKARRNGGTAYTPSNIEMKPTSAAADENLFIEGRNALRLDVANFLNLPAELLDGSTATASLTYSTQQGTRNELVDLSLNYWATPIEQRLSMDDMTPAGSSIQFDLSHLTTPTQSGKGPNLED